MDISPEISRLLFDTKSKISTKLDTGHKLGRVTPVTTSKTSHDKFSPIGLQTSQNVDIIHNSATFETSTDSKKVRKTKNPEKANGKEILLPNDENLLPADALLRNMLNPQPIIKKKPHPPCHDNTVKTKRHSKDLDAFTLKTETGQFDKTQDKSVKTMSKPDAIKFAKTNSTVTPYTKVGQSSVISQHKLVDPGPISGSNPQLNDRENANRDTCLRKELSRGYESGTVAKSSLGQLHDASNLRIHSQNTTRDISHRPRSGDIPKRTDNFSKIAAKESNKTGYGVNNEIACLETVAKSEQHDDSRFNWIRFRPIAVKEVIHQILVEHLHGKNYDGELCTEWTKEISSQIKLKLKDLGYDRYKFVVQVVIGEQRGEGVKMGCRCFWDSDTDNYAQDIFMNESLFCVAAAFGVFYY